MLHITHVDLCGESKKQNEEFITRPKASDTPSSREGSHKNTSPRVVSRPEIICCNLGEPRFGLRAEQTVITQRSFHRRTPSMRRSLAKRDAIERGGKLFSLSLILSEKLGPQITARDNCRAVQQKRTYRACLLQRLPSFNFFRFCFL